MRIIVGALWLILFLVLFAFAVNNTAATELHFFAGMGMQAPLIALLLAFFVGGFVFGFIALMPAWVRQRVEIRRLRRTGAAAAPRAPDSGVVVPGGPVARSADRRQPGPGLEATDVIQTVARGARTTN